ncbi:MAG: cytochrome P450 [Pseudomonadota bacterium]
MNDSTLAHNLKTTIPGDGGLPIVGHTLHFLADSQRLFEKKTRKYGPVYKTRLFGCNYIRLMGPDAMQLVFQNRDQTFLAKPAWIQVLDTLFQGGLLLMDDAEHKMHRRLMQVAFKSDAMIGYFNRMHEAIPHEIKALKSSHPISIYDLAKEATLHIACQVFLGNEVELQQQNPHKAHKLRQQINESFKATVAASISLVRWPVPGTRYNKGLKGRRFLERYFAAQVDQRRNINVNNGINEKNLDLFTRLCQAEGQAEGQAEDESTHLTNEQIVNHMIFLMMAAHDTTASTLTSMLHALTQYPQWQNILQKEFDSVNELTYDNISSLTKTNWFFKEALRMFPPLTALPRYASKSFEFSGYTIPAKSFIGISPVHTHFDEKYWTDPYSFDPERFSPERREDQRHPFQWVPFGGGIHKCIGLHFAEQEIKLFLFHILKNYNVRALNSAPVHFSKVPIWKPKKKLWLKFEAR